MNSRANADLVNFLEKMSDSAALSPSERDSMLKAAKKLKSAGRIMEMMTDISKKCSETGGHVTGPILKSLVIIYEKA